MTDKPCPYEAAFDERFFRGDEAEAVRTLKERFVPRAEYDALRAENERLREALEFYADSSSPIPNKGPWGVNSTDFGTKARAALANNG